MGKLKATVKAAEKALDMYQAARMKRAQEMGFDTEKVWYHGTPDSRGIRDEGFKTQMERAGQVDDDPRKAFFFSESPATAKTYADDSRAFDYQNAEPELMRLHLSPGNQASIDWGGRPFRGRESLGRKDLESELEVLQGAVDDAKRAWESGAGSKDAYISARKARDEFSRQSNSLMFKEYALADEIDRLRGEGYDSVLVKNIRDTYNAGGRPDNITVMLNNKGIRDVNADFDPAKKDSANLLAGIGGAAVIGGATQSNEANAMTDDMVMESLRAAASVAEFSERRKQKSSYWAGRRQDLLNLFTGITNNALDAVEMPWRGILGLTGAAGSLAAGNSMSDALNAGANMARQPVDQTAYQLGGAMTDATGSPALGTAVNLGVNMGGPI